MTWLDDVEARLKAATGIWWIKEQRQEAVDASLADIGPLVARLRAAEGLLATIFAQGFAEMEMDSIQEALAKYDAVREEV